MTKKQQEELIGKLAGLADEVKRLTAEIAQMRSERPVGVPYPVYPQIPYPHPWRPWFEPYRPYQPYWGISSGTNQMPLDAMAQVRK